MVRRERSFAVLGASGSDAAACAVPAWSSGCGWLPAPRGAGLRHHQVAAPRGARQQHAFQRHRAADAAAEMGEDHRDIGGAEPLGDGGEAARGGTMLEGCDEVVAVAEQYAEDMEDLRDVGGHGLAGPIRLRIGGRGRTGTGGRIVLHPGLITETNVYCQL